MNKLYSRINNYSLSIEKELNRIPSHRKEAVVPFIDYLSEQYKGGKRPKVIVICTHNSRRSHLGQLWLAKAGDYYDLPIKTYSGGTEATAFYPSAVTALKRAGFAIGLRQEQDNPTYLVKWKSDMSPYLAFSKRYDDPPNPTTGFAAIMICTSADMNCPIVEGTDFRLALPFEDPKKFDNTPVERDQYDERCRQIARMCFYIMKEVRAKAFRRVMKFES